MLKSFSLLLIDPWNFILFYFSLDILNVILISFEGIWRAVGWFATVAYGNSWICFARDWLWNSGTHPFMFWSHFCWKNSTFEFRQRKMIREPAKWTMSPYESMICTSVGLNMVLYFWKRWDWEHKQIEMLNYRSNINSWGAGVCVYFTIGFNF